MILGYILFGLGLILALSIFDRKVNKRNVGKVGWVLLAYSLFFFIVAPSSVLNPLSLCGWISCVFMYRAHGWEVGYRRGVEDMKINWRNMTTLEREKELDNVQK